ncbi:MAG: polymerase sigma factor RpoE [Myxococcales bacterium]|nr:polymerase sigma factor RpoE [Myxococcales bacterium]
MVPRAIRLPRPAASGPPTLESLYRDHFDFVYRVAHGLGARDVDPEDVAQEVFIIAARRLHTFDAATAQVTSWLYGITFNVVRSMRRRRWLELLYRADESAGLEVPIQSVERMDVLDAWRLANEILGAMAPKRRDVFVLAELEGLGCAEIAAIVGAKVETVWSRLHYARREFAARLAELRPESG